MTISAINPAARTYIYAGKPAEDEQGASSRPGEPIRVKLPAMAQAAAAQSAQQASASDDEPADPTERLLKQLEKQLQQVMQQIARLKASRIPGEQKAVQLNTLSAEAIQLQQQINSIQQQRLAAMKGAVTA